MAEGIRAIHGAAELLPLVITVYSLRLHAKITAVHEEKDYRLRPTVARLRNSFKAGDISV